MAEPTMELKCLTGPYAGQKIEYPKSVAEALLSTGQAEALAPETAAPKKETAVLPEPERRTTKRASPKAKAPKKKTKRG